MTQRLGRRRQVLEMLRSSEKSRTVSQLARHLQVHGNTVRFHLDSLLADGLIEIDDDAAGDRPVGRPAVRYRAVERVAPAQMRHTETLVRLFLDDLADDPNGQERAVHLGARWGAVRAQETEVVADNNSTLHPDVRALDSLLAEMGFESDPPTNSQILVKTCPFLNEVDMRKATERNGDLPAVCAVHLGVMKGALSEWEGELAVAELVPFSRPDRCRIGLTRRKSD